MGAFAASIIATLSGLKDFMVIFGVYVCMWGFVVVLSTIQRKYIFTSRPFLSLTYFLNILSASVYLFYWARFMITLGGAMQHDLEIIDDIVEYQCFKNK